MKAVGTASGHIPEALLSLRSVLLNVDPVDRRRFHVVVERADGEHARALAEELYGRVPSGRKERA